MATLQIRDLPDDLYRRMVAAAKAQRRSLAQQVVVELSRALAANPPECRVELLTRLRGSDRRLPGQASLPERLVRDDRDAR